MSFRNWLHSPPLGVGFVVVAMLLLAGLNNHYRKPTRADDSSAQKYQQTQPISATRSLAQGPAANDKAARDEDRTQRDLKAQEEMAKWAFWLFIVSGVGVVLLGATLRETYKAGQSAIDIMEQTRRQADLAENSFKRLERPYLFIEITDTNRLSNPDTFKPALIYKVVNYGKTPAIFKSIFLELRPISDLQFRNGSPRIPMSAPEKSWYEVLAQGKSTGTRPVEVMGSTIGQRIDSNEPLALHGRFRYEDPTKALHTYHFVLSRQRGRFCLEWSKDHTEYPKDNVT